MDTAPLPAIPPAQSASSRRSPARLRGPARGIEAVAGLLSAGLLVVGVSLVVLQLIAGRLAPGTGLAAADGPTWWRALAQLGVGALGECVVWARRILPAGARVWLATAVIVGVGAVLWFAWWR